MTTEEALKLLKQGTKKRLAKLEKEKQRIAAVLKELRGGH